MASDYDATEFVDTDFQAHKSPYSSTATGAGGSLRAPTREEVDVKVIEAQQKLAELKRAQEELERERVALEEVRRRQAEFQTGRQEMIHHLTRGLGLLEEAEFTAALVRRHQEDQANQQQRHDQDDAQDEHHSLLPAGHLFAKGQKEIGILNR